MPVGDRATRSGVTTETIRFYEPASGSSARSRGPFISRATLRARSSNKATAPPPIPTAGPSTSATITTLDPTTSTSPDPAPTTTTTTAGQPTATIALRPITPSTATTSAATSTTSTITATTGPAANNDNESQKQGQQKQYDVLANDHAGDAPLDPSTLTVVTQAAHGTATVVSNHKIRYQSESGYTGTAQLTYQICDTAGQLLLSRDDQTRHFGAPSRRRGDPDRRPATNSP